MHSVTLILIRHTEFKKAVPVYNIKAYDGLEI